MSGFSEEPAVYEPKLDKAAFLQWVQRQEGRFELKDGRIVMHAGSTKRHAGLSVNFVALLAKVLDPDIWVIFTADVAVEMEGDIRYPDVVVERRQDDGASLTTTTPVLIVEVLSPSSAGRDMNVKLAEYIGLPFLEIYIVASQEEPIVWVWQRQGEARAFPKLPTEIAGREAAIDLAQLGVSLPLSDIYRGIGG